MRIFETLIGGKLVEMGWSADLEDLIADETNKENLYISNVILDAYDEAFEYAVNTLQDFKFNPIWS